MIERSTESTTLLDERGLYAQRTLVVASLGEVGEAVAAQQGWCRMLYPSFRWPAAEVLTRLVRDSHAGRPHAIDDLLATLRPALLAFFQQRQSLDTAEDLTQLALMRISGAIARIDPERADSYISTVARNLLRTAYRATARDRAREGAADAEELPARGLDADARAEYEDLALAVHRACLTKLAPGLRDVAVGLLHGETPGEIANALHVSPITVRTRLMRVRAILRTELAPYLDERERRPA